MLDDLDETLKQLLIQKADLKPADVDISFDIPTRDWSSGSAATRPTVNLYLFDIRENRELREWHWDETQVMNGQATLRRRPIRIDLSYMITCWTTATEDQHRLLWTVLWTFFRHSPIPEDLLQGKVRDMVHQVRTEVAQPDGVLKNVSDFWGALENQLRPAINLTVTLDLDLNQETETPLVFARVLRVNRGTAEREPNGNMETLPFAWGGIIHDSQGKGVAGAEVRLLGRQADGTPIQVSPTQRTNEEGRFRFQSVPPGDYTLVVETGERRTQRSVSFQAPQAGEASPPELVYQLEAPMA